MSTRRGAKPAPTGRTTSPPAPPKRDNTHPVASRTGLEDAGGARLLNKAVGGAGGYSSRLQRPAVASSAVPAVPAAAPHPMPYRDVELKMQQMVTNAATKEQFETGSEEPPPHISCIAFDPTGMHMAYGDKAGRCYIFCKSNGRLASLTPNYEAPVAPQCAGYTLIDVVEAYQPQLDTLNSTEIEAKVNVLKFLNRGNGSLFFLTANDKTIKMWKVWERQLASLHSTYEPVDAILEDWSELKFPKIQKGSPTIWHKELKVFSADHDYHVNSISPSSNMENFISSDDLTVQLWHLSHHEQSLRVLDRHPDHMEELAETITSTSYHTTAPQEFCVASSKGVVSIYDLRQNLTCNTAARTLPAAPASGPNVYLSTILSGISDVKYSPCGTFIIARDYLSVKIWDARKEDLPIRTLHVHDGVHPRLTELYEHDYVFDRFEVATSPNGKELYTGSYRSELVQFCDDGSSKLYTTDTTSPHRPPIRDPNGRGAAVRPNPYEDMDFQSKTLHLAAHPEDDVLAVSCSHELFLYAA